MTMELRCNSRILHGIVVNGTVEFSCKSKRCGKEPGVVVIHSFNTKTGELVSTKLYREPEETADADCITRSAVRSA